jgi:hypothetical protein
LWCRDKDLSWRTLTSKPQKERGREEDRRDGVEMEIVGQEVWLTKSSVDKRQSLSLPREDWQKDQQKQSSPDLLDVSGVISFSSNEDPLASRRMEMGA